VKKQAQELREGTAVVASSRRAASHALCAYPWLGGSGVDANCIAMQTDAIAFTSKHRLRRPPDSWH
jgi:hypothetical protein